MTDYGTQGPWYRSSEAYLDERYAEFFEITNGTQEVALVFNNKADANKIAAAPDMFDALEGLMRLKKVLDVLEVWEVGLIHTTIAKAKGGGFNASDS